MSPSKKKGLGRGLKALFGDQKSIPIQEPVLTNNKSTANIGDLSPNKYQPRIHFDKTKLEELANSIKKNGIIQPIAVREDKFDAGRFEIIAGERRWRAAQMAQVHEVPAVVKEFSDQEALEIGLIENIQRSDLRPLEEADAFQRLIDEYGNTQELVAQAVGKSRSYVANSLRLLVLPVRAREYLEVGRITAGHARALLMSPEAEKLADYVVSGGLSVRATEKLVQDRLNNKKPSRPNAKRGKKLDTNGFNPDILALNPYRPS